MTTNLSGSAFKEMIINAAAAVNLEKQAINDLNVFPVPDGDTGTNMSLTINTAATELKRGSYDTITAAADAVSSALLRGARGNSGVILSLLFRGFAKAVKGSETADCKLFAEALTQGVQAAYKAVMKPTEGTILTVSRLSSDAAVAAAETAESIEQLLEIAISAGEAALENTINQNPVLQKAGVVDAGGKGYLCVLDGMLKSLRGEVIEMRDDGGADEIKADFANLADEEITFTYDTVFIVRKAQGVSIEPLRRYLSSIGDSLVIGEDDDIFKVHVHTDIPGDALTQSQKYGTLELAKIENMRSQAAALASGGTALSADDIDSEEPSAIKPAEPEKKFGVVSVCAGDGLANSFRELGADEIILGGQTMNPSTDDIYKKVMATPAEIVYVLPNNKNIIMAAEQCVPLCEDKKVVVIPTKSVMQGITAMMSYDPDMSEEELTETLSGAFAGVHSASITYAARDSEFDGKEIKQGQFLGMVEGAVLVNSSDFDAVVDTLTKSLGEFEPEMFTIFYGEDVLREDCEELKEAFQKAFPGADIVTAYGGQPVYYYLISAE